MCYVCMWNVKSTYEINDLESIALGSNILLEGVSGDANSSSVSEWVDIEQSGTYIQALV